MTQTRLPDPPWPWIEIRRDLAHPRAAPAFRCNYCGKWIGKDRPVPVVIIGLMPVIICVSCAGTDPAIRLRFGTRAAVARGLGLWKQARS